MDKYYLDLIDKTDLSFKEKEELKAACFDVDKDVYPNSNEYIANYFNSDGEMILALDVNEDSGAIDVLEYEI